MKMGKRIKNRCSPGKVRLLDKEEEDLYDLDDIVTEYCVRKPRRSDNRGSSSCNDMNPTVQPYTGASHGEWSVIIGLPSEKQCCLWNGKSRQRIQLPQLLVDLQQYFKCILTAPPTDKNCEILFFGKKCPHILSCRVVSQRWITLKYGTTEEHVFSEVVSCNGKIYAIRRGSKILYEVTTWPNVNVQDWGETEEARDDCPMKQHLVDSCGELFLVQTFSKHKLKVYKRYFSIGRWKRTTTIANRVFFLSRNHSVSLNAEAEGIDGNCIYFTTEGLRQMYGFNVGNEKFSIAQHSFDYGKFRRPWEGHLPTLRNIDHNPGNQQCKKPMGKKAIMDVDEENFNGFQLLPSDMLRKVASFLGFGRDYMNFRLVNRWWNFSAPPFSLRHDSESSIIPNPWLVFFQDQQKDAFNFYDPRENVTYHNNAVRLSSDCVIHFSKDGLLLIAQASSLFTLDPVTHKRHDLPRINIQNLCGMCFSGLPYSDLAVAAIAIEGNEESRIYFLHPNSKYWEWTGPIIFIPSLSSPIFFNGKFYFLGADGRLVMLTLLPELRYMWEVLNPPQNLNFPTTDFQSFLVSLKEDMIISVFVGKTCEWVLVHRFNMPDRKWELLPSLSDCTLFVSETSSLALKADESAGSMKNKIYFPWLSKANGHVLFYSMESCRFGSEEEDDSLIGTFEDTYENLNCTWFRHKFIPRI